MVNYATLWTEEEEAYLREEYPKGTSIDILSEHLGRSKLAINGFAKKAGIRRPRVWTEEKDDYLRAHYHDTLNTELAEVLGSTKAGVGARAHLLGLVKDKEFILEHTTGTQFKKGCVSANKGKKMFEWMSEEGMRNSSRTRFKKGNVPHNHKPVGWERYTRNAGWMVKVAEPNVFEIKSRVVWRNLHGEIPEGMVVVFKDGDRNNFDPGNLELKSQRDIMKENTIANYPKELLRAYGLMRSLNRKIKQMEEKEDGRHKQDE